MDTPVIEPVEHSEELPLPLYTSMAIGRMRLPDGEALTLSMGLSEDTVRHLTERALDLSDEELQAHTSDYARFGTGSYEDWYAKGRYPFALTNEDGALAALIWIGPEALPGTHETSWDTIAFRSYAPYRGKRIMSPFARFVLDTHARLFPGRSLWLSVSVTNDAGIRLYEKLGFTDQGFDESGARRILTLKR